MTQVICLAGGYGVGKSTLANSIPNAFVLPTSEALRQELIELGYSPQSVYKKPTEPLIRWAMHTHGDAQREEYGEEYWIERWALQVLKHNPKIAIIDDLRFMTDWEYILSIWQEAKLVFLGESTDGYDLEQLFDESHMVIKNRQGQSLIYDLIC